VAEEVINFIAHGGNLASASATEAAIFGGFIAALCGWHASPVLRWLHACMPQEELEPFQLLTRASEPGKRCAMGEGVGSAP
jgi:hypothetical protein